VVTREGGQFSSASGLPKIPRSKAEKIIEEVLGRVPEINHADYAFRISASPETNQASVMSTLLLTCKPKSLAPKWIVAYKNESRSRVRGATGFRMLLSGHIGRSKKCGGV
jgi:hypothetical protein